MGERGKLKNILPGDPTECPSDTDNTWGPFLYTHWNQKHPYNFYAPGESACYQTYYCDKAPAGCGPVAIAQVWNYYQKPDFYSYGWYDFPLDATLSSSYSCTGFASAPLREQQIAVLIQAAGTKAGSIYGFVGECETLTWRNDIKQAFSNAGYSNSGTRGGYLSNMSVMNTNLKSGHPVIMDGTTALFSDDWHIWVIDGLREINLYQPNEGGGEPYCYGWGYAYLHLNWGWSNSSQNAWYAFNNFTPIGGTEEYDYALNITYGMRP